MAAHAAQIAEMRAEAVAAAARRRLYGAEPGCRAPPPPPVRTMSRLPIGIVSAMHQELRALLLLRDPRRARLAGRDFHQGTIHGQPWRGCCRASSLGPPWRQPMHEFKVRQLVFTRCCRGLRHGVKVGDVVVAQQLLQHDMDASPLFPRFEIP